MLVDGFQIPTVSDHQDQLEIVAATFHSIDVGLALTVAVLKVTVVPQPPKIDTDQAGIEY